MKIASIIILSSVILFTSCNDNDGHKETIAESNHMHHDTKFVDGYADSINNGLIPEDTMKKSVPRVAMKTIGKTHIHINYSSPGVKGRIIWGGLVPFNTVWVTGAHNATKITFNEDIFIDNKKIQSGTYAIFTIPKEKEWIFILNKNYNQHLTDNYTEDEDIIRVAIKPQENVFTQRLTYIVNELENNSGTIEIHWEKVKLVVPFKTLN